MPTSLMPKGVEHITLGRRISVFAAVPTSLMPKGVEHVTTLEFAGLDGYVPTSLMPKGVEHFFTPGVFGGGACAHLSDAERR